MVRLCCVYFGFLDAAHMLARQGFSEVDTTKMFLACSHDDLCELSVIVVPYDIEHESRTLYSGKNIVYDRLVLVVNASFVQNRNNILVNVLVRMIGVVKKKHILASKVLWSLFWCWHIVFSRNLFR